MMRICNAAACRRLLLLAAAVALSLLVLSGCQQDTPAEESSPAHNLSAATTAPTQTQPVATEPPATEPLIPASGNAKEVSCQSSYSANESDAILAAHSTVATIGSETLSNAQLQIYYQMTVNAYRESQAETMPDFDQPLDQQLCPLSESPLTWEQYFLRQALELWHTCSAMVITSQNTTFPTEEAYKPNSTKHAENLKTKIYNLDVLYGYNTKYRIADAHQEYLDQLPEQLEQYAVNQGYDDLSDLTKDLAGIATNSEYLLKFAERYNEAYMFLTSVSYYIEPTDEEVEAYFAEHEADYAASGITKESGYYVNIRHILLNADAGSTTTAASLLKKWKSNATEANFSEIAFANSVDTGSAPNGGLYSNISKGQLTDEFDAWCFDAARKSGDTTTIKTDSGEHILYFSGTTDIWFATAQKDLIAQLLTDSITAAVEANPMDVDYSAIHLGQARSSESVIHIDDLLYPDIAHERFPVAPLYFQQDYDGTMYGKYSLVTYGCGITTMSMLTTYMTDDEWTPPEMCALYGKYCSDKGTAHSMFSEVPTDRGFYLIDRVFTWSEALEALEDGYMVVTLQREGYWTRGGHYLLLHNLLETDEGTMVQVRDSNLYNYKKLEGHTTGYFELSTIPANSRSYWIYQKKVVRIDSCVRCGQPTEDSLVPADLFEMSYYCPKCLTAMNRRDAFIRASFGTV